MDKYHNCKNYGSGNRCCRCGLFRCSNCLHDFDSKVFEDYYNFRDFHKRYKHHNGIVFVCDDCFPIIARICSMCEKDLQSDLKECIQCDITVCPTCRSSKNLCWECGKDTVVQVLLEERGLSQKEAMDLLLPPCGYNECPLPGYEIEDDGPAYCSHHFVEAIRCKEKEEESNQKKKQRIENQEEGDSVGT